MATYNIAQFTTNGVTYKIKDSVAREAASVLSSGKQDVINASNKLDAAYVNGLSNVATTGEYSDLLNKPTIPAAQVQSDWNATTGMGVILNKPTLANIATSGDYADLTNTPAFKTVATSGDYADLTNRPSLKTVATSGDYNDLTNKPTIPSTVAELSDSTNYLNIYDTTSTYLANVATSGEYADLLNKPTIPTVDQTYNASSANAQSGTAVANAISSAISAVYKPAGSVASVSGLPTLSASVLGNVYNMSAEFTTTADFVEGAGKKYPAGTNVVVVNTSATSTPVYKFDVLSGYIDLSPYALANSLSTVVTTGEYSDLLNKPALKTVATSGDYADLTNKPSIPAAQVQSDWNATSGMGVILNKPTLATVATSGEYSDLANRPALKTVATSGDYADLTNRPALKTVATTGEYSDLLNKPTIPAAQVQSDWNATSGMGVILNKPTLATVATSGEYSDLANKPTLATVATSGEYADVKNTPTWSYNATTETLTFA